MEPVPDDGTRLPAVPSRLFTQRKRAVILGALRDGQTIKAACARAGVHWSTYYEHINNEPEFQQAAERAKGEAEARLVDAITKSAHTGETVTTPGGRVTVRPGDWRAAAWLLEHHPHTRERYAAISKQQISGDPDNPTPVRQEQVGGEMTTLERMAAVVTVLQKAGIMPVPEPGGPVIIDITPDDEDGTPEAL